MAAVPVEPRWTRALVTGASSGIGRSFATVLGGAGTHLVLVARRQGRLEELAAELAAASPAVEVEVLVADLTDAGDLARVEARLADSGRPVDLLVNNAGFGTQGRFHTLPLDREEAEARLLMLAPLRLTHAAVAGMVERGRGAVVNVSSLVGVKPISLWATYSSSKAFLTAFSRAVDGEVRGLGVRVMVLMPGFTRTEFGYPEGFSISTVPKFLWMTPEVVARRALRDLAHGRAESVPGTHYRAFSHVARLVPNWLSHLVVKVATRRMWKR